MTYYLVLFFVGCILWLLFFLHPFPWSVLSALLFFWLFFAITASSTGRRVGSTNFTLFLWRLALKHISVSIQYISYTHIGFTTILATPVVAVLAEQPHVPLLIPLLVPSVSFTVTTLLSALIRGHSEGVCADGIPVTVAAISVGECKLGWMDIIVSIAVKGVRIGWQWNICWSGGRTTCWLSWYHFIHCAERCGEIGQQWGTCWSDRRTTCWLSQCCFICYAERGEQIGQWLRWPGGICWGGRRMTCWLSWCHFVHGAKGRIFWWI